MFLQRTLCPTAAKPQVASKMRFHTCEQMGGEPGVSPLAAWQESGRLLHDLRPLRLRSGQAGSLRRSFLRRVSLAPFDKLRICDRIYDRASKLPNQISRTRNSPSNYVVCPLSYSRPPTAAETVKKPTATASFLATEYTESTEMLRPRLVLS